MANYSNYSTLISSFAARTGTADNWLGDYASIKNGSYGKLMKAYYSSNASSSASTKKASSSGSVSITDKILEQKKELTTTKFKNKEEEKTSENTAETSASASTYNKVTAAANSVQDSIKKIQSTDSSDKDALASAVKSFVNSYNDAVSSASGVDNKSVTNRLSSIQNQTKSYERSLNAVGITVGTDGKLSLDEEKLKAADTYRVDNLFANNHSYAYGVSVSAGMMGSNASYAASKAATYTSSGTTDTTNAVGSLYNSYF